MENTDNTAMHPWLKPLQLGHGRQLPCGIIPGPMEGISEGSFIPVMSEAALVKCWFTPFIRISSGVPRNARLLQKVTPYLESGLPVIAQIMGVHTDLLAESARRLIRTGVTCADLNCACPSSTVIGSRSGGYTLKNPGWIKDTLIAMKRAAEGPVSVKIRCGFQSPDEIPDIAAAIAEARPSMVTCHFRTVKESYKQIPRTVALERLAEMRSLLPGIPLIGSGDLFTPADALEMYAVCGVDGVAPARGMLKNPALLLEIEAACAGKDPESTMSVQERLDFLKNVGARSGHRLREQGFVLKIAKIMFGEESDEFRQLMQYITK